jgi:hypothetical protein
MTIGSNVVQTLQGVGHNMVVNGTAAYSAQATDHIIVMTTEEAVADLTLLPFNKVNGGREFIIVNQRGGELHIQPPFTRGLGYADTNLAPGFTLTLMYDGTGYRRISLVPN